MPPCPEGARLGAPWPAVTGIRQTNGLETAGPACYTRGSKPDRTSTGERGSHVPKPPPARPVFVTRPALPPLADYAQTLAGVWERQWLTNNGACHETLEEKLRVWLGVPQLSLVCNGTMALLIALRMHCGREGGEVVTTPFTFPATVNAIDWMGFDPVFCDVDPATGNLDPARLAACLSPRTRGIVPVHVHGVPCAVEAIGAVAAHHGLPVIYDAAHTFGARYQGRPLCACGDAAILSFHATKLFATAEGGALVLNSGEGKVVAGLLRNFGIADAETVLLPGINGKMSELHAAFGLAQLPHVEDEIAARRRIDALYRDALNGVPGLRMPVLPAGTEHNGAYFPIYIEAAAFGHTRDAVYDHLLAHDVIARKYFHPLCSTYTFYAHLPSAAPENLPVSHRLASEVLCLPIYGSLREDEARRVADLVRSLSHA